MAIPSLPVPSLTDQTSFGANTQTFGGVSYAPPSGGSNIGGSIALPSSLPLAAGAIVLAGLIYWKWGR